MSPFPPLAFVTLRSTGSDPRVDDLTDLAVARVTARRVDFFAAHIRPAIPRMPRFGVMELALPDALDVARALLRGCVLVAFDAASTRAMLDGTCDFLGVARIGFDPRSLDVRSLVWPYVPGARTLADVRAALGFDEVADVAIGDLRSLVDVYRELVEVAS